MEPKNIPVVVSMRLFICLIVFLSIAGCKNEQPRSDMVKPSSGRVAGPALLATISDEEQPAPSEGHDWHATPPAAQGTSAPFMVFFSELGGGAAYIAQKDGGSYVVHNGSAGGRYQSVGSVALSRDGRRIAYGARTNDKWRVVVDGKEGRAYDGVGLPRFSSDGLHFLYDARVDEQWYLIVDEKKRVSCPPRYDYYDKFFSDDSGKIVFIENPLENDGPVRIIVADLELNKLSLKELRGTNPVYNMDRTLITFITESNGKKKVARMGIYHDDPVKEGPPYDAIIRPTFGTDGVSVAYIAERGGNRFIVLNDREEPLPDGILRDPPVISPNGKEAAIIIDDDDGAYIHRAFAGAGGKGERKKYQEAASFIFNVNGSRCAHIARQGKSVFMVMNDKEGPSYDMIVTPMFSPDGRKLIYRARKDGKRFVVVADEEGTVLRQHSGYDQVFQPVFTADGKSVAYGVKDGKKLIWKVERL